MEIIEYLSPFILETPKCWIWTGRVVDGFARQVVRGIREPVFVHVAMWEDVNGPLSDGLELKHKCGKKHCVRPDHLKIVGEEGKLLDGGELNKRKIRCIKGHPYSDENTYVDRVGKRRCRACEKARTAAVYQRTVFKKLREQLLQ